MRETITISLPPALKKKLADATKREHTNRSDIVREALRQYFTREEFQRLRKLILPEADRRQSDREGRLEAVSYSNASGFCYL